MTAVIKPSKVEVGKAEPIRSNKIRIALVSRNVKHVEEVLNDLRCNITKHKIPSRGPVRLPTKVLYITTRKSPCGEGTNTWDRFEMRIHKRIIDLFCPADKVHHLVNDLSVPPGLQIEVMIEDKPEVSKN